MNAHRFVTTRHLGTTLVVTISRPDVLNALHPPAHAELATTFDRFADADKLYAAKLTGEGSRAFCAGNDLKSLVNGAPAGLPASGFVGLTRRFGKPVIAPVNGLALGGGSRPRSHATLSLQVSMRASTGRSRGRTRGPVRRIAPPAPSHRRQARNTNHCVGASSISEEGYRLGLVSEAVERGQELARALALSEDIAAHSPMAVAQRSSSYPGSRYTDCRDDGGPIRLAGCGSNACLIDIEGRRAFAENRPPRWSGR